MVHVSLLREKLTTKNILINGASERTRAADCIFIHNRALYRSLIASVNVLDDVEGRIKIRACTTAYTICSHVPYRIFVR